MKGRQSLTDIQKMCIEKALESNAKMLSQIDRLLTFSLNREHCNLQPWIWKIRFHSAIDSFDD